MSTMGCMKLSLLTLCALPCLLLPAACSWLSPAKPLNAIIPATGFTLTADIEYGIDERQKFDIYFPEEAASASRTIIFIYGGAWRSGSRKEFEFVGQTLADAGHTVIIPDYRLYPSVVFPEFVNDIVSAISDVDERAVELLGSELDEIVLMGHSSGAHTAALLASDAEYLIDIDLETIALVAIAGPYDLSLDDIEVQPVFRNAEKSSDARPVDQVTESHPPTLLVHGENDKRVLPSHTARYTEVLKAAEINVQAEYLEDTGHIGSIAGLAAPLDAKNRYQEKVTDFLDSLQ